MPARKPKNSGIPLSMAAMALAAGIAVFLMLSIGTAVLPGFYCGLYNNLCPKPAP